MSNELFLRNNTIFQERFPASAQRVTAARTNAYTIIPAKDGLPTLGVQQDDRILYLHSKYAPLNEARNLIAQAVHKENDLVIIGGFGLGYCAEAALEASSSETRVIVVENDASVIKAALESRDIQDLLSNPRLSILCTDIASEIHGLLGEYETKNVACIIHRASAQRYPEFYDKLSFSIRSFLQRKDINIHTLARFERIWAQNCIRNAGAFLSTVPVLRLHNVCSGMPAVLVGAGPSLDAELPILKKYQEQLVIIVVDTALKILLRENITPDIVVAVDAQITNAHYFKYCDTSRTTLIAEPSTSPLIIRRFAGPVVMSSSLFPVISWLEEHTEEHGKLDMGGSVATTAFDAALKLGCNPIALIGVDLGYTKNRTHAHGAYSEQYRQRNTARMIPMETLWRKYIHHNIIIDMPTYSGGTVHTDRRLLLFLWWFQRKMKEIQATVVNCSQQGACIEGMPYQSFKRYCMELECQKKKNISISTVVRSLQSKSVQPDIKKIAAESLNIADSLESIARVMQKGVLQSQQLYRAVQENAGNRIQPLLHSLDEIDRTLTAAQKEQSFIAMTAQRTIHYITEGSTTEMTDEEKNNSHLIAARRSELLYRGLYNSCTLNAGLMRNLTILLNTTTSN